MNKNTKHVSLGYKSQVMLINGDKTVTRGNTQSGLALGSFSRIMLKITFFSLLGLLFVKPVAGVILLYYLLKS